MHEEKSVALGRFIATVHIQGVPLYMRRPVHTHKGLALFFLTRCFTIDRKNFFGKTTLTERLIILHNIPKKISQFFKELIILIVLVNYFYYWDNQSLARCRDSMIGLALLVCTYCTVL